MPDSPHMPVFMKNPAELIRRFTEAMSGYPDAPVRMTFGSPCAYVGGNMAVGLHGSGWFVRLPPAAAAELLAMDGAEPFSPVPGRPMRGYVLLPPSVIGDPDELALWIERSLDFVRSLPPKESSRRRG